MMCKICGKPEEDHHVFEPEVVFPKGCVCDRKTWGDPVRSICHEYVAGEDERCKNCEHDKCCHAR
jgi:hypothetical protein